MQTNAANQRSVAVSAAPVLFGSVTAPPVLLPVGEVAIRQAALVLSLGSFPWISRQRAGKTLAAARKAGAR